MKSSTVNISFNSDLLHEIDRVARDESRARSELIREAARMYIARKKQWESIFAFSANQVKTRSLTASDVGPAIRQYRQSQRH
jgi:CopG family transcriptional regulator / antitoxin EndoAI